MFHDRRSLADDIILGKFSQNILPVIARTKSLHYGLKLEHSLVPDAAESPSLLAVI